MMRAAVLGVTAIRQNKERPVYKPAFPDKFKFACISERIFIFYRIFAKVGSETLPLGNAVVCVFTNGLSVFCENSTLIMVNQ
jgi:hypothetical protein